jgi:thymidylate synthase
MNNLDTGYQQLLQNIIINGSKRGDRTGTGTISIFGGVFSHDMSEGFPLLTTKKMAVKTMITELKWFLKGDTNIKYLVDNGCNIWNGDAYKKYCKSVPNQHPNFLTTKEFVNTIKTNSEFAKEWGELGPIYGKQWRNWNGIDQIKNLIESLITNPNSRRHIVNAWNVGELNQMTLPPCHYGFQCYVDDGKLSLMWSQRSVDTFLGLPFNISSYGLLLLLLCEETGLKPGILKGSFGDTHLYQNHEDAAITQLGRIPYDLPTMKVSNVDILNGEFDWELIDYKYHPRINALLSN